MNKRGWQFGRQSVGIGGVRKMHIWSTKQVKNGLSSSVRRHYHFPFPPSPLLPFLFWCCAVPTVALFLGSILVFLPLLQNFLKTFREETQLKLKYETLSEPFVTTIQAFKIYFIFMFQTKYRTYIRWNKLLVMSWANMSSSIVKRSKMLFAGFEAWI